jgi:Fe-S-cluster containining protein
MATFCLTLHAAYRCRHSGECCGTWTVPAERRVMDLVSAAGITAGRHAAAPFVRTEAPDDGTWNIARDAGGNCVFFNRGGTRLCAIHEAAGEDALPTACRHFPRVVLLDGRGSFISLSHFCPTAASLLLDADSLRVVSAGGSLVLQEPVEGLDATCALPPLVRPGLLSDLHGYGAWEQACIDVFATPGTGWERAVNHIAAATERIRNWQPGTASLHSCVQAAFRDARHQEGADPHAHARVLATLGRLPGAPAHDLSDLYPANPAWSRRSSAERDLWDRAMRNYLAARVFGNWIAYQGRGLRSIVEWLRACAAVASHHAMGSVNCGANAEAPLRIVESFRAADLLLLHTIDSQAFATLVAPLEGPEPR